MIEHAIVSQLLSEVVDIAKAAGAVLLPYYQKIAAHQITRKNDKTPVTEADIAAHRIINDQLSQLTPNWPVLSEEGDIPVYGVRKQWQSYWLVDPLDGTRGFIRHSDEFTVNIALIEAGKPILGVIFQPVGGHCFYAVDGGRAYSQSGDEDASVLSLKANRSETLRILSGHYDKSAKLIQRLSPSLGEIQWIKMNSSLKFAALAEDVGDLYCRYGPTSEWDTAAGQCILTAAGGAVVDFSGKPLQYNAKSSLLNPSFLAVRDRSKVTSFINMIKQLEIRRES